MLKKLTIIPILILLIKTSYSLSSDVNAQLENINIKQNIHSNTLIFSTLIILIIVVILISYWSYKKITRLKKI